MTDPVYFYTGEPFEPGVCFSYVTTGETERGFYQVESMRPYLGAIGPMLALVEVKMATGGKRDHQVSVLGQRLQSFARFETCASCSHLMACILRGEPKALEYAP